MHPLPWIAVALVALSLVAWFAFELIPFVLYPLLLAAAVLVPWRLARRVRGPRP